MNYEEQNSVNGIPQESSSTAVALVELLRDAGKRNLIAAEQPAQDLDKSNSKPLDREVFRAEKVNIRFGWNASILRNFTWTGYEGLNIIVGPSGSGKSTLMKVLAGLLRPDSGRVFLDRQVVPYEDDLDSRLFLRDKVAFIHQDRHLIPHLSSIENVALPLRIQGVPKGEALERAEDMLTRLGIKNLHQRFHLSGGEELRVALGRALIGTAKVIFADEPTGSLDQDRSNSVMQQFKDLVSKEKKSVLLVTHNRLLAREFGDHIFEMGQGSLKPLAPVNVPNAVNSPGKK